VTDLSGEVTRILRAIAEGDSNAWESLVTLVYRELHILAQVAMKREKPGHTLQATALINELCVKLLKQENPDYEDRSNFFRAVVVAMDRILCSHARARGAAKRGGGKKREPLDPNMEPAKKKEGSSKYLNYLEALDIALERFRASENHRRASDVVDRRFFAGKTFKQIAEEIGISVATAKNDWKYAKAWLLRETKRIENHDR